MSYRKVALLAVGSFNPPTIAHLRMLETARSHLESNNIVVLEGIMSPVADSYNNKSTLIKANHRFKMVEAAVKSSKWIRADDWECTRPTWTRTLAVLTHHKEELQKKFGPETGLMLVVGGDVVDSFSKVLPDGSTLWNPCDIVKIIMDFGLVMIAREGSTPLETVKSMRDIAQYAKNIIMIKDEVCPCSVSSTRLRAAIAVDKSIKYSTPDEVIEYIREHSLYK
ncbi:unnamed protein product [Caenorhabditis bovis]|uniref:Nicotinamide-nucleotide adenylyltransferase n=1 Tax=Caenorhabditis bovis TaxID=2654633 RepID=A0A8S1FB43_9PELO|nr:unnamed protein product [Caenorhabditis bovis]